MSNVDMLLASIDRDPDDLTAVAALTDALIEEQDMSRAEADTRAERAVQTARDARDLAAAAELLRADKPWYFELSRDILASCGVPATVSAQVILKPGECVPYYQITNNAPVGSWWAETTVTVGALWVVRHWRSNPSLCLMPKAKKPRRTRSR